MFPLIIIAVITSILHDAASTGADHDNCTSVDDYQCELILIRNMLKDYNTIIRPINDRSSQTIVTVELTLKTLRELNAKYQVLTTIVWLHLNWKDEFIHWNIDTYNKIESIHLQSTQVWSPDILLFNNVDDERTAIEVLSDTKLTITYDGQVSWSTPLLVKSTCKLNVTYYPYDVQKCPIEFGAMSRPNEEITLRKSTNEPSLSEYKVNPNGEWEIIKIRCVESEKSFDSKDNSYGYVTYNVIMRRHARFYLFHLAFPVSLLMIIGILVFLVPPQSGEKVQLSVTTLLSMIFFMSVIMNSIPPTSDVISLFALYVGGVIILLSLATYLCVMVTHIYFRGVMRKRPSNFTKTIVLNYLARALGIGKMNVFSMCGLPCYNDEDENGLHHHITTDAYEVDLGLLQCNNNNINQITRKQIYSELAIVNPNLRNVSSRYRIPEYNELRGNNNKNNNGNINNNNYNNIDKVESKINNSNSPGSEINKINTNVNKTIDTKKDDEEAKKGIAENKNKSVEKQSSKKIKVKISKKLKPLSNKNTVTKLGDSSTKPENLNVTSPTQIADIGAKSAVPIVEHSISEKTTMIEKIANKDNIKGAELPKPDPTVAPNIKLQIKSSQDAIKSSNIVKSKQSKRKGSSPVKINKITPVIVQKVPVMNSSTTHVQDKEKGKHPETNTVIIGNNTDIGSNGKPGNPSKCIGINTPVKSDKDTSKITQNVSKDSPIIEKKVELIKSDIVNNSTSKTDIKVSASTKKLGENDVTQSKSAIPDHRGSTKSSVGSVGLGIDFGKGANRSYAANDSVAGAYRLGSLSPTFNSKPGANGLLVARSDVNEPVIVDTGLQIPGSVRDNIMKSGDSSVTRDSGNFNNSDLQKIYNAAPVYESTELDLCAKIAPQFMPTKSNLRNRKNNDAKYSSTNSSEALLMNQRRNSTNAFRPKNTLHNIDSKNRLNIRNSNTKMSRFIENSPNSLDGSILKRNSPRGSCKNIKIANPNKTSLNPSDQLIETMANIAEDMLDEIRSMRSDVYLGNSDELIQQVVNEEWHDVAYVLDRLFFFMYILINTVFGVILVAYIPDNKYDKYIN